MPRDDHPRSPFRHAAPLLIGIVTVALVGLAAATVTAPPAAAVARFGTPAGLPFSATDIDDLGRVVGGGSIYDPRSNRRTDLPTLGGHTTAVAITTGGLVAGSSTLSPLDLETHAIVYRITGELTDLGTVGFNSTATDVSDAGLVVGSGFGEPGVMHGFVFDLRTGTKSILEAGSEALGVNDAGLVLGQDGASHPFVLDTRTGLRTDLADRIDGVIEATKLSNSGLVAGTTAGNRPFVHDLATNTTWVSPSNEAFGEFPEVTGLTDGGAVTGTAHSLDFDAGFVAVPESGRADTIPPPPGDNAATGDAINGHGELVGRNCFWETITPAQHCNQPYLRTVRLEPAAPLQVAASSCAAPATVSWRPPRFDGFDPVTGYELRRNGKPIATLPSTATSFVDRTASVGVAYQVVARNAEGASPPSAAAIWPTVPCRPNILRGTVTAGGIPQAGIVVRLVAASDGHLVRKATTGPVGTYWFAAVPAGRYQLRFSDPTLRLLLEWFDGSPVRTTARVLDVPATGEVIADADLTAAARVAGHVADTRGGVTGINVRLYDATSGALVAKTTTGPGGVFTIESLVAGDVKIRLDDPAGFHRLQWYGGGGATISDAPQFSLVAGETLDVDTTLDGAGVVTGTVVRATGTSVANLPVIVYDTNGRTILGHSTTDAAGRFRILAVRPGPVLVRFGDGASFPVDWYRGQPTSATAQPVDVVDGATAVADETYILRG